MNLEKLAYNWISVKAQEVDIKSNFYCQTRDIFQARLEKTPGDLLKNDKMDEGDSYVLAAMVGEIGNNSFDHNLGSWPDVAGIFFAYDFYNNSLKIVLADRGQGVFSSLKKVKPEIKDDSEALKVAFLEKISGRAPENRGNGLKFVKENIEAKNMRLLFISGTAEARLNKKMEIKETTKNIKGCLAIIDYSNLCE